MPLSNAQVRRLVTRYQERIETIGEREARSVVEAWLAAGSSFDDLDEFVKRASPTLNRTKAASVQLATALYATLLEVVPPAVRPESIDTDDETREPFIAYWRAINNGATTEDALIAGAARAEAITRNLAVSAGRRTGDAVALSVDREVGWQRMTDSDPCDWCRSLTSEVWPSSKAADFGHDRCGCTPVPA